MSREFKSEETRNYSAQVTIQEQITYGPPQNSYGDIKESAKPRDRGRQVLEVSLNADSLEKLQEKIVAHVELAE